MKSIVVFLFAIGAFFSLGAAIKLIGIAVFINDGTYPGEIALLPWSFFWPSPLVFLAWTKPMKNY